MTIFFDRCIRAAGCLTIPPAVQASRTSKQYQLAILNSMSVLQLVDASVQGLPK